MMLTAEQQAVIDTQERHAVVTASAGCIDGSAIIGVNRAKKGFQMKLEQVVAQFNRWDYMSDRKSHQQRMRKWNPDIPTDVQCVHPDGTIRLGRLKAAWYSGKKVVYEVVSESGRKLRATEDHLFMTSAAGEFKRLGDLSVGDYVYTNKGQASGRKKPKSYYLQTPTKSHPHQVHRGKGGYSVATHRLVVEADMNNLELSVYIAMLKDRNADLSGMKFLTTEVVHHIDHNHQNNSLSNLHVCKSHLEHNAQHKEFAAHVLYKAGAEKIVSINKIPELIDTYDLELEGDPHNFVANGFVVHNSGKTHTLVERVLSLVDNGEPPESIVILTFSRAAAKEFRERLGDLAGRVHVGTFHSVILEIMAGCGQKPSVLTQEEADAALEEAALSVGVATRVRGQVKWKKSAAYWRKTVDARVEHPLTNAYLSKNRMRGDIDYTTILINGLQMIKDGQGWGKCRHVIVDECQDNDALQWTITRELAKTASVLTCGDVNQCIHAWRGSVPEVLDALPWPRLPLTKTFRCRRNHVDLANRIQFINVEMTTDKPDGTIVEQGDTLSLVQQALAKFDPEDIAVLCRYNQEADDLCQKFESSSIPHARNKKVERGPIYWLLRFLASPNSQTARMKASEAITPYIGLTSDPLLTLVSSAKPTIGMLVEQWLSKVGVSYGPEEILGAINLPSFLHPEADMYAREYRGETLDCFRRDEAELTMSPITGITVSTIHGAKGLEWPCVFVLMSGARVNVEECRLFYVGVTRTQDTLVLPGNGGWKNYLKD